MSDKETSGINKKIIKKAYNILGLMTFEDIQQSKILRIEVPINNLELFPWLSCQKTNKKFYWKNRNGETEIAACGNLISFSSSENHISENLFNNIFKYIKNTNIQVYGGLRFDDNNKLQQKWNEYSNYFFLIPNCEIIKKNETTLALNFLIDSSDTSDKLLIRVKNLINKLEFESKELANDIDNHYTRNDEPKKKEWLTNIEKSISILEKNKIKKIVLARQSEIFLRNNCDSTQIFEKLKELNSDSFCFYFALNKDIAFMGASPERLYNRDGNRINTDALAGTRVRGINIYEDNALESDLLKSRKDLEEHNYVFEYIKNNFQVFCNEISTSNETHVKKLTNIQHLYKEVSGHLKEGMNDFNIINALHPTPAVGGIPKKESLKIIRDIEDFDRGWYAAPIGWFAEDSAEFAVGIRSGLFKDGRLILYSGAGIVKGSQPDSEWEEINNKLMNFLRVFDK